MLYRTLLAVWIVLVSIALANGEPRPPIEPPLRTVDVNVSVKVLQPTETRDGDSPSTPQFPPVEDLPVVKTLPNPWEFFDGRPPVTTYEEWDLRREEMKALLQHYECGHMPPLPSGTTGKITYSGSRFGGKATLYEADVTMGPKGSVSGTVTFMVPSGKGPFPVILYTAYNHNRQAVVESKPFIEKVIDRGYIAAEWYCYEYDEDKGRGQVKDAFPSSDCATLMVWAWAGSGCVDYFRSLPYVDPDKIVLTGNSRRGKATLLAGAFDDRIKMVVPSCSGAGGDPLFRYQGSGSETLEAIVKRFPYWFHPRFADFINKENQLPYDHHFLRALVAPRAVLGIDGSKDNWANQEGSQESCRAAQPVYDWFEVGNRNGWYQHDGGHGYFEDDWYTTCDFADLIFHGKKPTSGKQFDQLIYPPQKLFRWTAPARPSR